jgi:hypothetical protein
MGKVNWLSILVLIFTVASLVATAMGEPLTAISLGVLGVACAILAHLR